MGLLDAPAVKPAPDGWGAHFVTDPTARSLPAVYKPQALRRFYADLADAYATQINIVAIGDSEALGIGSDNNVNNAGSGATENSSFESFSWPPVLQKLLNAHLGTPDPGLGLLRGGNIASAGSPGSYRQTFTGTGTTTANTTAGGPLQVATKLPSTSASCTWTLPVGVTEIDVMYSLIGTLAPPTGTIDGTAFGAITGGTTNTNNRANIGTGLAAGSAHTVVLTGAAAQSYIGGLIVRNQKTNGVLVHRIGIGGLKADIAAGAALSGTNQAILYAAQFGLLSPSLVIISYSINDWLASETIASYKSYLQLMITYITGTLGKCVLLVDNPQSFHTAGTTPPAPTTPTRADYAQAMRDLCDSQDHVAFLSHASTFGTFTQAQSSDVNLMLSATNTHPNRRGYGLMGRNVYRALTLQNLAQQVN